MYLKRINPEYLLKLEPHKHRKTPAYKLSPSLVLTKEALEAAIAEDPDNFCITDDHLNKVSFRLNGFPQALDSVQKFLKPTSTIVLKRTPATLDIAPTCIEDVEKLLLEFGWRTPVHGIFEKRPITINGHLPCWPRYVIGCFFPDIAENMIPVGVGRYIVTIQDLAGILSIACSPVPLRKTGSDDNFVADFTEFDLPLDTLTIFTPHRKTFLDV